MLQHCSQQFTIGIIRASALEQEGEEDEKEGEKEEEVEGEQEDADMVDILSHIILGFIHK